MKIYDFESYEEYKQANIEMNVRKLDLAKFTYHKYAPVVNYIKKHISTIKFGLCHGIRSGDEVDYFIKQLKCKAIGTDISPTVNQFKNGFEWDFHNIKDWWINSCDFIYSNALDHSHSPKYCISQWIKCLRSTGLCFVEWDVDHVDADSPADCFGATKDEYRNMFKELGCYHDEFLVFPDLEKVMFILKKVNIPDGKYKAKF